MTRGFPPAGLVEPSSRGYLYAGLSVDPPGRAPFVRRSSRRGEVIGQWRELAESMTGVPEVVGATVYEAVLIPPIAGGPRFDVIMLVQTTSVETLAAVPIEKLQAELVMPARNVRRIGDIDAKAPGTYLFNHFTAPDPEAGVAAWERLAGWYTFKAGVDNSALLRPVEDRGPFAFVNHVRLPGSAPTFLLNQFLRPSFHRYVRATLKANGMVAMPILCRPA
ncbi:MULTISPECIES: hypothetical protein [unclassified Nonomuraea]|uniref:hypothetical protein n=1 Tax=unclassified Nonomuraea TaxID=2593643 RepID=UPI0035C1F5B3